jgi:MATE family multidrug resistance protein
MVRLALPVVIAELGWITMGIVDTVMVGPLGPAALGAVGTGSTMFFALVVLGMGTLLALDTFVSQGFGAGQISECHRWLLAGLQLAAVMSVALVAVALAGVALLPRAGLHPAVIVLLQPYLGSLLWSIPPLLAFTVFRRYLQAMHVVRPVMVALVSANLINVAANWVLVYGHLGLPALGVVGSAYATLAARIYLAAVLWGVILLRERKNPSGFHDVPWIIEWARMGRLVRLGAPAAGQVMLEVGVFAVAGALAARITPDALAANQIVLNVAGFVFMVPFGLGSAAAVRVGHAVGAGDGARARRAGWVAIALAVTFALAMSTTFAIVPGPFLRIFTTDATVLRTGALVLLIYAASQPFDACQAVATGALRGLGETRVPMVANLLGHWGIGLPLACYLCFGRAWGVAGLWAGLCLSLVLIGVVLVVVWHVKARHLGGRHLGGS